MCPALEGGFLTTGPPGKPSVLPFRKTVTVRASRASRKVRPVRSVGLVVQSYLGNSLLSPGGCTRGQREVLVPLAVPWLPRGKLWTAQMAKNKWSQGRPMWINAVFLPIQVWADPGSVALFVPPSPPPTMPSASWTVSCLTAPF